MNADKRLLIYDGFSWLADFMTELTVITVLTRLELEADIIPRCLLVAEIVHNLYLSGTDQYKYLVKSWYRL